MLPTPALEAAAKWVPGVISLALFVLFFGLWVRSLLERIRRLERVNETQDKAFQALLLELGSFVRVADNRDTINGVWRVLRRVDKALFGTRVQLNLPPLPMDDGDNK